MFFFSSRRRHTILTCDWSSDVCSSDLTTDPLLGVPQSGAPSRGSVVLSRVAFRLPRARDSVATCPQAWRSEERRVGKEGWFRWALQRVASKRLACLRRGTL